MGLLRTDLWAAAFVRRHNDLGHFCVVARRGDPVAGQVFIVIDHLNGTQSLLTPAPALAVEDGDADRVFELRFERAGPDAVDARIAREADFDPDLWVLSLDLRTGDAGVRMARL